MESQLYLPSAPQAPKSYTLTFKTYLHSVKSFLEILGGVVFNAEHLGCCLIYFWGFHGWHLQLVLSLLLPMSLSIQVSRTNFVVVFNSKPICLPFTLFLRYLLQNTIVIYGDFKYFNYIYISHLVLSHKFNVKGHSFLSCWLVMFIKKF